MAHKKEHFLTSPPPLAPQVNKDNVPLAGLEGYNVNAETGTLIIHELKPEHSGTYRCTAANPAGDVAAEANLLVLTKPKVRGVYKEVEWDEFILYIRVL